jgi:acyl-CoA thioesterase-1
MIPSISSARWLGFLMAFIFCYSAATAAARLETVQTRVFVEGGKALLVDASATLGEAEAGGGYLAVRSAKPGSSSEYAAHYSSIALAAEPILAAGDFEVSAKLAIVRLDRRTTPLTFCVKLGGHYYDLLLADGSVALQGVRFDAVRYEPFGVRHSVPIKLDGTPFTLAFARHEGRMRITLDGRLIQELWVEPSEGDIALLVDRERLLRVTEGEDVEAELRVYDWRGTGGFVQMTDDRRTWNQLVSRPRQLMKRVGGAYAYVADDPKLPNVLLIGDSISIYYTDPVRRLLAGHADVYRTPMGPGKAETLFAGLDEFLQTRKWDVIHFNTGLHDFGHTKGTEEELTTYRNNLETIVGKLEKTGAKLIWASTTPVPPDSPATSDELAVRYNAAARKLMEEHGIPTDDLYAAVKSNHPQYWLAPRNVHFNDLGSATLGRRVAAEVMSILEIALPTTQR